MLRGPGCYLEELSWPQAQAALQRYSPAVLPIGAGCKEHGLHLPLCTDRLQAEFLSRQLVERLPVLALPVLSYGYYPAFVEYPGSVSIGRNTCRDTVVDICRSVAAHGANKIYLLNTGISTNWSLEPARHLLAASKIVMDYTDLSRLNMGSAAKCIEQSAGSHADEVETSRMLHIAPDQVRMDLAKPELCGGGKAGPLTRNPTRQNAQYSPSGVFGDPTLATAHKGELLTLALVECLIEDIERLASADYQAPPPRQQYL